MTQADPGNHAPTPAKGVLKAELRQRQLDARASSRGRRASLDHERTTRLLAELPPEAVVALYLSREGEPDTLELAGHLVARRPVLAPVLQGRREPDWAWLSSMDALRPGLWGIPEPTGEALGADALAAVDVVLCSALAVTAEGRRLGVGGGWFDRALAHAPQAQRWVLVDDEDVLDDLPSEPHDLLVHRVVTPTRTIVCGTRGDAG